MIGPMQMWALNMGKLLLRDMPESSDPDWDGLEQRLAIGLIQARALALRDFRMELNLNRHLYKSAHDLIAYLVESSHVLEMMGMDMAKQWPPLELCPWACQNPECGAGFKQSLDRCPRCDAQGLEFMVRQRTAEEVCVEPGPRLLK